MLKAGKPAFEAGDTKWPEDSESQREGGSRPAKCAHGGDITRPHTAIANDKLALPS